MKSELQNGGFHYPGLVIYKKECSSSVMLDRLHKDSERRFEIRFIQDPLLLLGAIDRFHPDIIVTDNWYQRSERDYWDVMLSVLNFHPETRVVVVAKQRDRGRDLPMERWYFNGVPVINKDDATSGDNLARIILSIV